MLILFSLFISFPTVFAFGEESLLFPDENALSPDIPLFSSPEDPDVDLQMSFSSDYSAEQNFSVFSDYSLDISQQEEAFPVQLLDSEFLSESLGISDVENGSVPDKQAFLERQDSEIFLHKQEDQDGQELETISDESELLEDQESEIFTKESETALETILWDDFPEIETYSITVINPVYEGVITPQDIPVVTISEADCRALLSLASDTFASFSVSPNSLRDANAFYSSVDSSVFYTDISSAGRFLKDSLLQRTPEIRIFFRSETEVDWAALCKAIYANAVIHTGIPTEGDYLRYEYGGYNAKGSGPSKPTNADYFSYLMIYSPLYYTTPEQEAEMNDLVSSVLGSLNLSGKSDMQKIRSIYDYLCSNVSYDYTHESDKSYTLKFTGYAALSDKTAVCQGFSVAFYRLCLELGIDARVIESKAMIHAWNIVLLDGSYYALDSTWDSGCINYLYYLRGSDYWLSNHQKSGYSTMGDQFNDSFFASSYKVPSWDYHTCEGTELTAFIAATRSEPGYTGDYLCPVCGKIVLKGEIVPALGYEFSDVSDPDKYYFTPVYWAVDNHITTGFGGAGMFSPDTACTREQIVTFLWRLKGCPEPTAMAGFVDVVSGAWYEKPINWAFENGITTGLNDGTGRFGIAQPCTREQCVTFLWRALGNPSLSGSFAFTDLRSGAYYYNAVIWAAEAGITVGLNDGTGRFGVGLSCSRAMVVTFLNRYAG